ncbi:MAG: SpaH/EbpB family LPXTG-anchored major pilin, partial [Clostridiaceae bacterium]
VMNAARTDYISDLHIYPKNLTVRGAVVLSKYVGQMGLAGAKFRLFKGVAPGGVEYDPEGPALPVEFITDENGWIIVNNLPVGNYYFVETFAPAPYLLNDTPIPFTITANGKVEITQGDPDVLVPTGNVKYVSLENFMEPDISKSVMEIGTIAGSGDYHEPLDFFLNIVLPADILGYIKLEVTDMIDTKLDYKDTLVVEGSSDGINFTALVDPDQYDVVNEPAPDGDGLLKIAFVPEKLKDVAGATLTHLRISFKAAINETAIMGDAIVNKAMVYYNNGTVDGDDESNEVKVYTGGKNFIKRDSKTEAPLAGAEFAVKNGIGQFLKIGVNGEYIWVATLAETTFRLISGEDGKFEIKGLQYNLELGTTYYLVETKAPMSAMGYPYNLIKDQIPFVVNATSYYIDPTVIELGSDPATATPMTVLNILGPQIPQTGGIGTMLFTLIGGGLMGSAVLLNKKRTRK